MQYHKLLHMQTEMAQTTTNTYTILHLPNEILGLALSFLGPGHFAFIALVCNRFKETYLDNVSDEKITCGESITASISCARQYFEDAGTGGQQFAVFWCNTALYGRLDVMKWAYQRGYSRIWRQTVKSMNHIIGADHCLGTLTCCIAASSGHLDMLQWLRQNECEWNWSTCANAAAAGHLSILQWARENGCPWDRETCSTAAYGGHLTVLQWARENGCDWNWETCSCAALGGHLPVLKWARENGCEWNWNTFEAAQTCGNPDLLQYVIDQECPRRSALQEFLSSITIEDILEVFAELNRN